MSTYTELENYYEDRNLFQKLSDVNYRLTNEIMEEFYAKIREIEKNIYREEPYSPEDIEELLITLENIKGNMEEIRKSGMNPRNLLNTFMLLQYNMDLLK